MASFRQFKPEDQKQTLDQLPPIPKLENFQQFSFQDDVPPIQIILHLWQGDKNVAVFCQCLMIEITPDETYSSLCAKLDSILNSKLHICESHADPAIKIPLNTSSTKIKLSKLPIILNFSNFNGHIESIRDNQTQLGLMVYSNRLCNSFKRSCTIFDLYTPAKQSKILKQQEKTKESSWNKLIAPPSSRIEHLSQFVPGLTTSDSNLISNNKDELSKIILRVQQTHPKMVVHPDLCLKFAKHALQERNMIGSCDIRRMPPFIKKLLKSREKKHSKTIKKKRSISLYLNGDPTDEYFNEDDCDDYAEDNESDVQPPAAKKQKHSDEVQSQLDQLTAIVFSMQESIQSLTKQKDE